MNFLKTLFWVVLAAALAVFAARNWTTVTLNLWGGMQADAKLPVLLLLAFVGGALPVYLWQRAVRWRRDRRVVAPTPAASTDPLAPAAALDVPTTPVV